MEDLLNVSLGGWASIFTVGISVLLLLIGALECFAGYKLMRIMFAISGFFIGVAIGVGIGIGTEKLWVGIVAALILGVGLAFTLFKLYLVGVFVFTGLGAGMIALNVLLAIGENISINTADIVISALIGILAGVAAALFVRPVIIVASALSGAEIIITASRLLLGLAMSDIAVIQHKFQIITVSLWLAVSAAGVLCQYKTSVKNKPSALTFLKDRHARNATTFSEKKYPGMQRAYRNFCIKCGCELTGNYSQCPNCGFILESGQ